MVDVGAAGYGAGPHSNDQLRRWHGVVGFLESNPHVLADRASDQQAVGVPRRGDELNSEPAEVEDDGVENVDIRLAGVATGGANLPQLERAAEEALQPLVERGGKLFQAAVSAQQSFAGPGGQAVIVRELNRAARAGLEAVRAEQAPPHVELEPAVRQVDRARRTGRAAFV